MDFIDKYKIIKEIGCGCNGIVYESINKKTSEKVALKKISIKSPENIDEIICLRLISSKYVVKLLDNNVDKEHIFIVMEYLKDYIELHKLIHEDSNFLKKDLSMLIKNICHGIDDIHLQGVSHNDFKSQNILINPSNLEIKIIDFGFSTYDTVSTPKIVCESHSDPLFILEEPKFLRDKSNLEKTKNGDLWSLGIIIYNIITKYNPHRNYEHFVDYAKNYDFSLDYNKNKIENYLNRLSFNVNLSLLITKKELRVNPKYYN
jgi:serine/threonine protein kinase